MRSLFLLASVLLVGVAHAQNAPVAMDDFFNTKADSTLTIDAPGVLANDTGAIPIEAVVTTPPQHGTLTLARDGSFVYEPTPGFSGVDFFNYVAEEVDLPEQFEVDPAVAGVRMFATLNTSSGSPSDNDTSGVAGTLVADLVPNTEPFSQIQLTGMDLVLSDAMSFNFGFSVFGSVNVDTDADSLNLTIATPGPAASVSSGLFTQSGNDLGMAGRLDVSADGLVSTQVPSGPQMLDVTVPTVFGGTIVQNEQELTLSFPLFAEGSFEVSGNTIDVTLQGTITATGPVVAPQTSNVATVAISVVSGVGTEEDPARTFVLRQNYPNPVDGRTMIVYQLPEPAPVQLAVYDALGRRITTLVDAFQTAGLHSSSLDASGLPVGMYFYRLQAGTRADMKTLVVLR